MPDSVIVSGKFKFFDGMERKFEIDPCKTYELDITPQEGTLILKLGASEKSRVIRERYQAAIEWSNAPYIRVSSENNGVCGIIQAEIKE